MAHEQSSKKSHERDDEANKNVVETPAKKPCVDRPTLSLKDSCKQVFSLLDNRSLWRVRAVSRDWQRWSEEVIVENKCGNDHIIVDNSECDYYRFWDKEVYQTNGKMLWVPILRKTLSGLLKSCKRILDEGKLPHEPLIRNIVKYTVLAFLVSMEDFYNILKYDGEEPMAAYFYKYNYINNTLDDIKALNSRLSGELKIAPVLSDLTIYSSDGFEFSPTTQYCSN